MMYEMATIFDIYWTEIDSGRTKGAEKTGQRVNEWLMQQAGREGGRMKESILFLLPSTWEAESAPIIFL